MAEKSVIIIGAGIAGLAVGCYARMNGYRTQIFEMDDKPGGLCTSWERKGYTVDGCIHWLMGSAPGASLYPFWNELGILPQLPVINLDQLYRFEDAHGRVFNVYTDIDRLEQHMKELSPQDGDYITRIAAAMRKLIHFEVPAGKAPDLYGPLDGIKMMFRMLPYMGLLRAWGRKSQAEFANGFRDPLLRESWLTSWPEDFTSLFMLITLSSMHMKQSGYVLGGSTAISRAIEKRYLDLGGQVSYKSRVARIIVENDRAVGVKLADGAEDRADYVISAADGHATIWDLLDGRYVDSTIQGYYDRLPRFPALLYMGFGVNRTFDELPKTISGVAFKPEKPLSIGGQEHKWLTVRIHNFDPSLAPPGRTLLTTIISSDYGYWKALRLQMSRYREEKEKAAAAVMAALEQRFPGIAGQIEMKDVATPVTFERYTGNWKGCFEGWLITPKTLTLQMKKTLPGLDRFYMAGQWVAPGGGIPSGAISGRWVTQMLCKRDGKRFTATVP